MHPALDDRALDQLFRQARTHYAWRDVPVPDDTLRALYDLLKWAPTSANGNPARFVFLRTPESKQRLVPALRSSNVAKVLTAPVTVIVGFDLKFYEQLPALFPHNARMRELFAASPELSEATARRNSSLQGAYLILAARALGLDCGPMSGFENHKVDEEFFAPRPADDPRGPALFPGGQVRSNFLCNLGFGSADEAFPRLPRLDFTEACALL